MKVEGGVAVERLCREEEDGKEGRVGVGGWEEEEPQCGILSLEGRKRRREVETVGIVYKTNLDWGL